MGIMEFSVLLLGREIGNQFSTGIHHLTTTQATGIREVVYNATVYNLFSSDKEIPQPSVGPEHKSMTT